MAFVRIRQILLATIATAAITACGSADSGAASEQKVGEAGLQGSVATPPPEANKSDAPVNVASLPQDLSGYQRKILGDGVLTATEYQKAAFDAVRCHQEYGATIKGYPRFMGEEGAPEPWWSPRGQYMFVAAYPKDDPLAQEHNQSCTSTYFSVIEPIWDDHIAPTPKEVQEARDIVGRCLNEAGIAVPEHPSTQDLVPIVQPRLLDPPVNTCLRLGAEHIGMPAFMG